MHTNDSPVESGGAQIAARISRRLPHLAVLGSYLFIGGRTLVVLVLAVAIFVFVVRVLPRAGAVATLFSMLAAGILLPVVAAAHTFISLH